MPTRYPEGRGFKFIASGGAVAVADTMRAAYERLVSELLNAGYTKLQAQVTLEKTGITGVFEKPFFLTTAAEPVPGQVEALSELLQTLRTILEKYNLWVELFQEQDQKEEARIRKFSY